MQLGRGYCSHTMDSGTPDENATCALDSWGKIFSPEQLDDHIKKAVTIEALLSIAHLARQRLAKQGRMRKKGFAESLSAAHGASSQRIFAALARAAGQRSGE